MANPNTWMDTYVRNITQLNNFLEELRTLNAQLDGDPTLITGYFTVDANGVNATGGRPRKDIVEQDVKNAEAAIVQMLFTFDSGSPSQKSLLFKMQP